MQLANRAAKGDQRAIQLVVRLVEATTAGPPPKAPERLDEADKMVVAELVRRIRSST